MMMGVLAVVMTIVLAATTNAAGPSAIIEVVDPEPYSMPLPPANTAVYPNGTSECDLKLAAFMNLTQICLKSYVTGADNPIWCRHSDGCRRSIQGQIDPLFLACLQERPDSTISNLIDQFLYAATEACSSNNSTCDGQDDLFDAARSYAYNRRLQCTPCLKKTYGRQFLEQGSPDSNWYKKNDCNRVAGQYCYEVAPANRTQCSACYQRSLAKALVNKRWYGEPRPDPEYPPRHYEDQMLACYDNGHGISCLDHLKTHLTESYGVRYTSDGHVDDFGALRDCQQDYMFCGHPKCLLLLKILVRQAGCCARALPFALSGSMMGRTWALVTDHCLWSLVEDRMQGARGQCLPPVQYGVDIRVQSTLPAETICELVRADLATTLAMFADQIDCESVRSPGQDDGVVTVRATIRRHVAAVDGLSSSVAFDPDLLQDPVISVVTRTPI